MCEVLKVSRSSFYKYLNKTESKRSVENKMYEEEILKIYKDSKGRYGAPKIHKVLREERGHAISLKRVQRIMKKLNIKSIIIKKFRPHSSKSKIEAKENVLKRDFSTTTINETDGAILLQFWIFIQRKLLAMLFQRLWIQN